MGSLINTIIGNDTLFYGIIIFLVTGVIVLFMYIHGKKNDSSIMEEIEVNKIDDNTDATSNEQKVSQDDVLEKIEEKVDKIDGREAINKIMNENLSEFDKNEDTVVEKNKVIENPKLSLNENIENNIENIELNSSSINNELDKEESKNDNIETSKLNNKDNKKSELEVMLEKMKQDLEEQKEKDAVAMFEQEQEERAIISYKELLEKKNELVSMAESSDDERFENEAVKHDDTSLTNSYMEIVDKVNDIMNVNQAIDENKTESKKFVTTDFISPVFGRREAKLDYPTVPNFKEMINSKKTSEYNLEATMNMEPINEQIKKDDAFLNALKEFRKNLE